MAPFGDIRASALIRKRTTSNPVHGSRKVLETLSSRAHNRRQHSPSMDASPSEQIEPRSPCPLGFAQLGEVRPQERILYERQNLHTKHCTQGKTKPTLCMYFSMIVLQELRPEDHMSHGCCSWRPPYIRLQSYHDLRRHKSAHHAATKREAAHLRV